MSIFGRNLEALKRRFPHIAADVEGSDAEASSLVETARSGEPTLRLCSPDGPGPYLHSRIDPRRDGRRRGDEVSPKVGYLVVWGPGLFYEIEYLLERPALALVVAIEPSEGMIRAALSARDIAHLLRNPRLHLLVGTSAEASEAARYVKSTYVPVLHGAFRVEPARPRADEARQTTDAVRSAATGQLEDVSIQRRFGLRWFSNAVRNLLAAESPPVHLPVRPEMVVAAAGPSLEESAALLHGSLPVISTDTALPVLLQRGIRPVAVVSLDCQQVSYHHLLVGGTEARDVPLAADLSSPPTVLRHVRRAVLTAGGHPFTHLVQEQLTGIISIDGSGGNVTQAAVSFATKLGARRVFLVGADLSYPQGRPYARDCYVYPYFRSRETRLEPAHAQLWDMVLADPQTKGEPQHEDGTARTYRTPKLDMYRERLAEYVSGLDAEVVFEPPPARARVSQTGTREFTRADRTLRRAVLEAVAEELEELVLPSQPSGTHGEAAPANRADPGSWAEADGGFAALSRRQQALWYALIPSAAAFLEGDLDVRNASRVLLHARQWAVGVIRGALER
ncbi:MAG: 6-hydroxymethylpterin diphosphokinase MptE-like protein [Spirochaetota bacterium]